MEREPLRPGEAAVALELLMVAGSVNVMVFVIVGVAIVSVVALFLMKRRLGDDAGLGSMSEKWLAENRASRH